MSDDNSKLPVRYGTTRHDVEKAHQQSQRKTGEEYDFVRAADPYYDPVFCEMIIHWASQSMYPEEWAAELGLSEATVHSWVNKFPEFAEAWAIAVTKLRAAFTRDMRLAAHGKMAFAQGALINVMAKKRFPDLYGDSKDVTPVRDMRNVTPGEINASSEVDELDNMDSEELLKELEALRQRHAIK